MQVARQQLPGGSRDRGPGIASSVRRRLPMAKDWEPARIVSRRRDTPKSVRVRWRLRLAIHTEFEIPACITIVLYQLIKQPCLLPHAVWAKQFSLLSAFRVLGARWPRLEWSDARAMHQSRPGRLQTWPGPLSWARCPQVLANRYGAGSY